MLAEKLSEAIEAKNNDIKSFVWKYPRKNDGSQDSIKMIDATPEQLQEFYNHCNSMLYSTDKSNPGRYTLLDIIEDQRKKCNIELFLRSLEKGTLAADGDPYPRHLFAQDMNVFLNNNREVIPRDKYDELSISVAMNTKSLPREYKRLTIADVRDGYLDALGSFDNKHITFSFILGLGIYLTPEEMNELLERDKDGKARSKMEVIKERLKINPTINLKVKPGGLNYSELRAMLNLRPKKYSDLTTDQLITLRNKVLFRLEEEVNYHIEQWENRIRQLILTATERGITLYDEQHNSIQTP